MSNYNSVLSIVYWLKATLPYSCDEFGLIPSIQQLAKLKGCSTTTMHKAVKVLCEEGFLHSRHGLGTFIKRQKLDSEKQNSKTIVHPERIKINSGESLVVLLPIDSRSILPYSKAVAEYLEQFCIGVSAMALEYSIKITFQYVDIVKNNFSKSFRSAMQYIKKNNVQKIIAVGFYNQEIFLRLASLNVPCMIVDHWPNGVNLPSINPDHFSATKELVYLLANLQHTQIGLIDRPDTSLNKEIMNGFLSGLEATRLTFNQKFVFNLNHSNFSNEMHIKELEIVMLSKNPPTAIICFSHKVMIEFLKQCDKWQLKVPQDISLVTYVHKHLFISPYQISGIFFDWVEVGKLVVKKMLSEKQNKITSELFGYSVIPGNTLGFRQLKK